MSKHTPFVPFGGPTPTDTRSIIATFALAAVIPAVVLVLSYPTAAALTLLVLAAAVLVGRTGLRTLADRHTRLSVPGIDVEVSLSRAR